MTDHNGGFLYSNTIELNNGTDATITVYPNPAVSNVTVHTAFANGLLSIMDMSGKIYLTRSINSTITPLDIKGLKQGVYTVAIQNEEGRKTTEMIVGE